MSSYPKYARHLVERDGQYFALVRVPLLLRPVLGESEIKEALGDDRNSALENVSRALRSIRQILSAARQSIARELPPVSIAQAARDLYADEIRRHELEGIDADADSIAYESMAWSRQAYIERLKFIRDHQITSRFWLDTDRPSRSQAIDTLLHTITADPLCDDAHIAFCHLETNTQDTFIDATIGWAIIDACRGRTAPLRGSEEWITLARALAGAQIEALHAIEERMNRRPRKGRHLRP